MSRLKKVLLALSVFAMASAPERIFACAACFGKNDSAMAQGMNAGIFVLLGVVVTVLGGTATVGIYLVRRASKLSQAAQTNEAAVQPQV